MCGVKRRKEKKDYWERDYSIILLKHVLGRITYSFKLFLVFSRRFIDVTKLVGFLKK